MNFFKTTRDVLFPQSYDQRFFSVDDLSNFFLWKKTRLEIQNLITIVLFGLHGIFHFLIRSPSPRHCGRHYLVMVETYLLNFGIRVLEGCWKAIRLTKKVLESLYVQLENKKGDPGLAFISSLMWTRRCSGSIEVQLFLQRWKPYLVARAWKWTLAFKSI